MNTPLLTVDNAWKSFPGAAGELTILRGINLKLEAGASAAITGPSGSGKSTLLHLIGALDRPTRGRILLDGQDLAAGSEDQLAGFRNRHLGFVFQLHHLLPQLNVFENVMAPTLMAGAARGAARERAHRLLERVGLTSRLCHRPSELSGDRKSTRLNSSHRT